MANTRKH